MIATCNICRNFAVPWDEIGKAIMKEHLKECYKGKVKENVDRATSTVAT